MSGSLLDDDGIPEEVDDEFLNKLEAVADAEQRVANLTAELDRIDIGLDEEDTRRLLWAHLTGWSLSDISETFEAVEDLQRRDSRDLTVRLLAQLSNNSREDVRDFLDECDRLDRKYGSSEEA
ncbi:hypothetical protein [Halorubrum aethiopicum]|uniref:hypothetical protein n=1 Tax=Halorubrum aethiopicum TaxID=1758255 RepID=UPI000831573D|nr:hypothetical protein [Halorubrum aethiopicum]